MKTTFETNDSKFRPITVKIEINSLDDLRKFLIATSLDADIFDVIYRDLGDGNEMIPLGEIQEASGAVVSDEMWQDLSNIYAKHCESDKI